MADTDFRETRRRTVVRSIDGIGAIVGGSGLGTATRPDGADADRQSMTTVPSSFEKDGKRLMTELVRRGELSSAVSFRKLARTGGSVSTHSIGDDTITHLEFEHEGIKFVYLVERDRTVAIRWNNDPVGYAIDEATGDITKEDCYLTSYNYCSTEDCKEEDAPLGTEQFYQQVCCGGGCSVVRDGCCEN